jgi:hypothetical protein
VCVCPLLFSHVSSRVRYPHIVAQQDVAWARFEATTRNTLQAYGALPALDAIIHSSDIEAGEASDTGSVELSQYAQARGGSEDVRADKIAWMTRLVMKDNGVFSLASLRQQVASKLNERKKDKGRGEERMDAFHTHTHNHTCIHS